MKFRKRPVVIDAVPYDGKAPHPPGIVFKWTDSHGKLVYTSGAPLTSHIAVIRTLEGDMIASLGDWIIRGVEGEYYPCKPDIFEKTYERIEPDEDTT